MRKYNSTWIERNSYYLEDSSNIDGQTIPHFKQIFRPQIACLCGSSRFRADHEKVQGLLGLKGIIGVPMSQYGHLTGLDMYGPVKVALDELHKRKIDLADFVFVVNSHCYICAKCGTWGGTHAPPRCECSSPGMGVHHSSAPYIGESTRSEIEYAQRQSKPIIYLYHPESGEEINWECSFVDVEQVEDWVEGKLSEKEKELLRDDSLAGAIREKAGRRMAEEVERLTIGVETDQTYQGVEGLALPGKLLATPTDTIAADVAKVEGSMREKLDKEAVAPANPYKACPKCGGSGRVHGEVCVKVCKECGGTGQVLA